MKWVVDASPLCYPLTGIGQYVRGLLQALPAMKPEWSFVLMAPYEPLIDVTSTNVLWDPSIARARHQRRPGWRAWWFDVELPRAMSGLDASAFWAADGLAPWALREIDVALTVYDFVPERFPATMSWFPRIYRQRNAKRWMSCARWRLPISHSTAGEMVSMHHVAADAIVYPGIDPIFFEADTGTSPPGSDPDYVVVVGTLEPRKNLVALAEAVESLVT
jgi:glycosyltransferase involved in cell wall biosynthesis